jgi:hypothetical protein
MFNDNPSNLLTIANDVLFDDLSDDQSSLSYSLIKSRI